MRPIKRTRWGFTLLESLLAISLLGFALIIVAQLATWSLADRKHCDTRLEVIEAADNILEAARACPWEQLTPGWAEHQKLPEHLMKSPQGLRLAVQVKSNANDPLLKLVRVQVRWPSSHGSKNAVIQNNDIQLEACFAPRQSMGGKP